jgi:polyribonucleotide 5'-hydroxyl-kinase
LSSSDDAATAVDGGDPVKEAGGGEGSPSPPPPPLPPSLGVYLVEDPDDTASRVACVNTHAQLEALRDEALAAAAAAASASSSSSSSASAAAASQGPRVLVAGSAASGKTSLVHTLLNYAAKLGRAPLWVDLDPDGSIGVPGALCAAAASRDALLLRSSLPQLVSGGGGCPGGSGAGASSSSSLSPLCLWHGSTSPESNPDLFRAQASSLAAKVNARLSAPENAWERSSGVLVDAPSYYAADENYPDLLGAVRDFGITVVLLTGHDKLYARLRSDLDPGSVVVVKLPRSGGAEDRDPRLARAVRSRTIRRYFYGDASPGEGAAPSAASPPPPPSASLAAAGGRNKPRGGGAHQPPPPQDRPPSHHPALTPFLVQLRFDQIRLYRVTTMSLSSSLLPLGAQQTTDVLQLQSVPVTEQITHRLLGVCHPRSVSDFDRTGSASRLYGSGVAGFVVVERVLMESETVHLLAPCAGALPSHTLLVGDITWMD